MCSTEYIVYFIRAKINGARMVKIYVCLFPVSKEREQHAFSGRGGVRRGRDGGISACSFSVAVHVANQGTDSILRGMVDGTRTSDMAKT